MPHNTVIHKRTLNSDIAAVLDTPEDTLGHSTAELGRQYSVWSLRFLVYALLSYQFMTAYWFLFMCCEMRPQSPSYPTRCHILSSFAWLSRHNNGCVKAWQASVQHQLSLAYLQVLLAGIGDVKPCLMAMGIRQREIRATYVLHYVAIRAVEAGREAIPSVLL